MVAISLYRGNLHRVPDVPRRWLMPKPSISLKDFRDLLNRRSKALSLLQSSASTSTAADVVITTTTSTILNLNPNSPPPPFSPSPEKEQREPQVLQQLVEHKNHQSSNLCTEQLKVELPEVIVEENKGEEEENDEVKVTKGEEKVGLEVKAEEKVGLEVKAEEKVGDVLEDETGGGPEGLQAVEKEEKEIEKVIVKADPVANNKVDTFDEKEKRRKEVEEKLLILNAKKHNLVQALKHILTAEEELKRRSNTQAQKPSLTLQVDASIDSGSMTKADTLRMGLGSEANVGGEAGVEADDVLNHNPHSHQLLYMSSTSPSAESALRRPPYFQHNLVSHPSRASIVAAGSPSRFAPPGNQGQPPNLPTVSVTGTNYIASSPSPAASGGSSAFRDSRHLSPWN